MSSFNAETTREAALASRSPGTRRGIMLYADGHTVALRPSDAPRGPLARGLASALGLGAALISPVTALAGSTFVVTTAGDPGLGNTLSLRQAVAAASGSDGNTVVFDPSLAGSTITLATGEIVVSRAMNIVGLGADRLAVSGNDSSRIFKLDCADTNAQVAISSLTLTHGKVVGDNGGALYSRKCKLQMSQVRVSASTADAGGGVRFDNGAITNSVITGCSAGAAGGGLVIKGGPGDIHVDQSTISFNTALNEAGGVLVSGANFYDSTRITHFDQSTINGNSVTGKIAGGGGIMVLLSKVDISRSTVTGNHAYQSGGGIGFFDAYSANNSVLYHATVSDNYSTNTADTAASAGNGIYSAGGTLAVASSIVAGNFNKYRITDLSGSFYVLESLVQAPDAATITGNNSIFGVDPGLANLANNGGPTATMLPNPGSPALDKIPLCGSDDQRGVPTCANGATDMGSVERQIPEVIIFRNGFEPG
jgi:hypothetical protein